DDRRGCRLGFGLGCRLGLGLGLGLRGRAEFDGDGGSGLAQLDAALERLDAAVDRAHAQRIGAEVELGASRVNAARTDEHLAGLMTDELELGLAGAVEGGLSLARELADVGAEAAGRDGVVE